MFLHHHHCLQPTSLFFFFFQSPSFSSRWWWWWKRPENESLEQEGWRRWHQTAAGGSTTSRCSDVRSWTRLIRIILDDDHKEYDQGQDTMIDHNHHRRRWSKGWPQIWSGSRWVSKWVLRKSRPNLVTTYYSNRSGSWPVPGPGQRFAVAETLFLQVLTFLLESVL